MVGVAGSGPERFPRRAHTPATRATRSYVVVLYTADEDDRGEPPGEVVITLYGAGDPPRRTLRHPLVHSSRNAVPFRRGQADCFLLRTLRDIGPLSGIRIGLESPDAAWRCHHVEVLDSARQQWTFFMCRAWLGGDAPQRRVLRPGRNSPHDTGEQHCYKVAVTTANEAGAGLPSGAAVDINLLGVGAASGPLPLAASATRPLPTCQRGDTDLFYFDLPHLGQLTRVELVPRALGSGRAWHLRHIEVTKLDSGTAALVSFAHDSVVPPPGVPAGHGLLVRPGQPAPEPPDAGADWAYEVAVYTGMSPHAGQAADVVLSLWGDANLEGEPAQRRLLSHVWQSHWAPVLHEAESAALCAAQPAQAQHLLLDTALPSPPPHSHQQPGVRSTSPTRPPAARSRRGGALPVEVRRSVEPARRSRTKPVPRKERAGSRPDTLPRKKMAPTSALHDPPPADPIEALRQHGLLEGMEHLFAPPCEGDGSAPARSVLSSGLGRRAEPLLSLRSSYCHALGPYSPEGEEAVALFRTSAAAAAAHRDIVVQRYSGAESAPHPAEGELAAAAPFDEEEEEEKEEEGEDRYSMDSSFEHGSENHPEDEAPPGKALRSGRKVLRAPRGGGPWSPGRCAVFLVDAVGLGRLKRVALETKGFNTCAGGVEAARNGENDAAGWMVDRVEVWDRSDGQAYTFSAGQEGKRLPSGGSLQLSAGRAVATYHVTIHTLPATEGSCGVAGEVWLTFDHQGNTGGRPRPALLRCRGAAGHTFRAGSREAFAVTLPDLGDAPDRVHLRCGALRPADPSPTREGQWCVDRVEVCRAGSARTFNYVLDSGKHSLPLQSHGEASFSLPLQPLQGLGAPQQAGADESPAKYRVSVQTSNVRGAGTQASAWVALYGVDADGQETTSGALQLSGGALLAMLSSLDSGEAGGGLSDAEVEQMREDLHSPQDRFERGKADHFLLECPAVLGQLARVLLWTDGTGLEPDWHVYQVEVAALCAGPSLRTFFPRDDWLAEGLQPPEWAPADMQRASCGPWAVLETGPRLPPCPPPSPSSWKYRIEVYTSRLRDAGTDVEVYLTLRGKRGESGPHELGVPLLLDASRYADPLQPDLFEPGQIDVFVLDGPDLGPLTSLRVGHYGADCNAAWHLSQVVVVDQHPAGRRGLLHVSACPRYHFECDRWLAKFLEDGQTMVDLPQVGMRHCKSPRPMLRSSLPASFGSSHKRQAPPKKGLYVPGAGQPISPITLEDIVGPGGEPWRHCGSTIKPRETDLVKGRSALASAEAAAAAMGEGQAERFLVAEAQARIQERVSFG